MHKLHIALFGLAAVAGLLAGCGGPATVSTKVSEPSPTSTVSSPTPSTSPASTSSNGPSNAPSSAPAVPPSASPSGTPSSAVSWVSVTIPGPVGTPIGYGIFPSTWGAPSVQTGANGGGTITYSSPNNADQIQFTVSSSYGFNHNSLVQSDPFNPDMPVPNGCTMNQQVNQDWYVFGCSNGAIGAVFTQPDYSGGVMVIGSGPDTQIIDHILANVHLYNADIGLGG